MTLPEGGPATTELVKTHLGITDATDDASIGAAVGAVNAQVRAWPAAAPADGLASWDTLANVVHGSVMLAARLWARRNTPEGVATFGSDAPAYVQRNDPDVAMLLSLGAWAKPAVG